MATAVVKKIVFDRGFGFLQDEADGREHFFHVNRLRNGLKWAESLVGQRVYYEIEQTEKGSRAKLVTSIHQ